MRGLLIVVVYNQEKQIGNVLRDIRENASLRDVLVVDDGSTDDTPDIVGRSGFDFIRHKKNQGVGAAIRTGIQTAVSRHFDFVVIMSGNGKMKARDIKKMSEPILNAKADYVQGSRFLSETNSPGLPFFRKVAIPIFSAIAAIFLKQKFSDLTAGFRAYRLEVVKDLELDQSWLNRYEMEYYIHYKVCHAKWRILEVPIEMDYSHLTWRTRSKITPIVGWWSMVRPFILLTLKLKN